MALILSVNSAFNEMNLQCYMDKCFEIVTGESCDQSTLQNLTVIHICLAHFMKLIKRKYKKKYSKGLEFLMFVIGRLTRVKTIQDAENIIYLFT